MDAILAEFHRPIMKRLILFVAAFMLAALPFSRAELSFEEGATRHLSEVTQGESSGVAVLVARDGKVVFQGGFGFADIAKKRRSRWRRNSA